jgi:Ran GTPase-activating protein (RanGAP) involved in mRNA processing and transport
VNLETWECTSPQLLPSCRTRCTNDSPVTGAGEQEVPAIDTRMDEAGKCVAGALGSLTRLTSLDLSSSRGLSHGTWRWRNRLPAREAIAGTLALGAMDCTGLRELDLSRGSLSEAAIDLLDAQLPLLHQLTLLRLDEALYCCNDAGRACMLGMLSSLTGLQELSLSGNRLASVGAAALAPTLQQLQVMSRLDLHDSAFDDAAACALADGLPMCSELVQLDLRRNREIGEEGKAALCAALAALAKLGHIDACCKWEESLAVRDKSASKSAMRVQQKVGLGM